MPAYLKIENVGVCPPEGFSISSGNCWKVGLTNGKTKPPVRCFTSILDGGTMLNGYYRNGEVFINADLAGSGFFVAGREALSDRLVKVALEECVHYVTGATDNSRDFQDDLLDLAVKLGRSRSKSEMR